MPPSTIQRRYAGDPESRRSGGRAVQGRRLTPKRQCARVRRCVIRPDNVQKILVTQMAWTPLTTIAQVDALK
jgi:hypothetical protein